MDAMMFHDLFWTVKTAWPADTFTSHIAVALANHQQSKGHKLNKLYTTKAGSMHGMAVAFW